jgi:hypothetical protein
MSSTIDPSAMGSVQSLAKTIMDNFDANKDGQFSADEFGDFLNAFVKNMTGSATASAAAAPAASKNATASPFLAALESAAPAKESESLPPCPIGWDGAKWTNSGHTTVKYVAGRVMARFKPSDWVDPGTREQILSAFRAAGLTPTSVGKDRCDFGDGHGEIDIVQDATNGGRAWQWLPTDH